MLYYKLNQKIRQKRFHFKQRSKKLSVIHLRQLREFIVANKNNKLNLATITEKANGFLQPPHTISKSGVRKCIKRCLKFSYKKTLKKRNIVLETDYTNQRILVSQLLAELYSAGSDIISIDECSIGMGDNKPYCWGPKKGRLIIFSENNPKRCSLCVAISKNGQISAQIIDGPCNQFTYCYFIKKTLEIMKKHHIFDRENTFFLIDNLSVHKAGLVREYKRFEGLKVLYNAPLIRI